MAKLSVPSRPGSPYRTARVPPDLPVISPFRVIPGAAWKQMLETTPGRKQPIRVWHATSSSAEPGPNEVCCQKWLDAEEQQRADRFRVATSRNQNIVGRGMARRLLSDNLVDPRSIRFAVEPHGKPFVSEPDWAKQPFNIAHTDGLVLCGIGSDRHCLIGVDVEKLGRATDTDLADRYFSRPEADHLRKISDLDQRQNVFLKIWTLKESFIKAIGTGLHTPLADFAFEEIDSDAPKIRMLNPKLESDRIWSFFCIEPKPGYIGAVAVAGENLSPEQIQIEVRCFDDLVTRNPEAT